MNNGTKKDYASALVDRLYMIAAGEANAPRQEAFEGEAKRLRRETFERPIISVGAGTCGLGAGAGKTLAAIRAHLFATGREADLVEVGCIGLCSAEPLVDVHLPGRTRILFSKVEEGSAAKVIDSVFSGRIADAQVLGQIRQAGAKPWPGVEFLDEHPFFAPQTRWVLENCGIIDPASLDEYIARGGYAAMAETLRDRRSIEVCETVEAAGLRGRGGGGFPTGTKWKIALNTEADQRYLICNADEGDPGAFMDRAVIEGDPHRLIEGMVIAGHGIGATRGYVYIRAEYPLAIERLKLALAQAEANGLLGENILNTGVSFTLKIKMGAGAFVCGEETALMHSIEGKRGMPRPRPPFPAVQGLHKKPTIINNVETLANLPKLMAIGAGVFAAVGTETSKGTKVFALSGNVVNTGLCEVAMGTTVRDVVFAIGGGIPNGKAFKGVQIGGPSGGCVPEQHLDIAVDYESVKTIGAMMGSGGLVVMDEDTCMVDVAKFFMEFIQRESCGKCIPCREGTLQLLETMKTITQGRKSERKLDALRRFQGVMQIERLAEVIKDTSLCGLGQTAPNPVLSTLRWFRDEYEAHIFERRCPAGVCQELRTFEIVAEKCTGCGSCKVKCPVEAIVGLPERIHYVIDEKCIGCGACDDACNYDAVIIAERLAAAMAVEEEDTSVRGLFSRSVYNDWHDGRGLIRKS